MTRVLSLRWWPMSDQGRQLPLPTREYGGRIYSRCMCRFPQPGPMHWDWRCLTCSAVVPGMWESFMRLIGRRPR